MAYRFMDRFLELMQDEIETVVVNFSFFPEKDEIRSFTRQDPSELDVKDFHRRHLGNYYEHICAWQILSNREDVEDVLMDGFQGFRTRAWEDLRGDLDRLSMVHKGDQVDPMISASDLLMDLMQKEFEEEGRWIGKDEISDYLGDYSFDVSPEYLGNSLLAVLTPVENRHIPTHKIVREPVFMIIRPDTSKIGKKELMDSPQGVKLQNLVGDEDGSLKFYNSQEDKDKLGPGSKLVYVNEDGEREARLLVENYGYDADLVDFRQI